MEVPRGGCERGGLWAGPPTSGLGGQLGAGSADWYCLSCSAQVGKAAVRGRADPPPRAARAGWRPGLVTEVSNRRTRVRGLLSGRAAEFTEMPKMKSRGSVKRRFKITKSGKVKCSRTQRGHMHAPKNGKQKRGKRSRLVIAGTWATLMRRMMK